jgi:hypothetical protein
MALRGQVGLLFGHRLPSVSGLENSEPLPSAADGLALGVILPKYNRIARRVLTMIDFGRQASLNGRKFGTLAQAIAHKDPKDVMATIAFEDDAVTGEPAPGDLFHDDIERLWASPEFKAYLAHSSEKPEINEREAEELIKGMGREAAVVVHDNGLVRATAIYGDLSQIHRIQNEVDGLLQNVRRRYRIVKKKRTAR